MNKEKVDIYIVDAFTNELFKGNPAAVCLDFLNETSNKEKDKLFQKIANEMSLSETAFITKSLKNVKKNRYFLQWFTPTPEIDLCGHATLAMGHILFEKEDIDEIIFETKYVGELIIKKDIENKLLQLNFPIDELNIIYFKEDTLKNLKIHLNIKNKILDVYSCKITKNLLIRIENMDDLLNLDKNKIFNLNLEGYEKNIIGIIFTTNDNKTFKEYNNYDFVSRYFAPWVGVLEDPVTGSIHTALSKYWSNILNKNNFIAYQVSNRGGILHIKNKDNRVFISGNAITTLKGELNIKKIRII